MKRKTIREVRITDADIETYRVATGCMGRTECSAWYEEIKAGLKAVVTRKLAQRDRRK